MSRRLERNTGNYAVEGSVTTGISVEDIDPRVIFLWPQYRCLTPVMVSMQLPGMNFYTANLNNFLVSLLCSVPLDFNRV